MLKSFSLFFIVLILCLIPLKAEAFSDIYDHWAKNDIEKLAAVNIVSGYSDGTFRPNRTVKRDEFICMVMRLVEERLGSVAYEAALADSHTKALLPWEEEFDKAYSSLQLAGTYWARNSILSAVSMRLLPYQNYNVRYTNTNDLSLKINRGEAAYILSRTAKLFGLNADRMLHYYIKPIISDVSYSTNSFSTALLDTYSLGIITGYNDSTLRPHNTINRAEAVAMLIKLYDKNRLEPFTPEGVPFIMLKNLAKQKAMRYYPPIVNDKPLSDILHLIQTLQKSIEKSEGYIQLTYNPENAVLGLEFYNTKEDYLALSRCTTQESYIKTLPLTLYMTFTISPENITRYSTAFRENQINSKYNPYLLVSWGNGFEEDILSNHLLVLRDCFNYLFGAEGKIFEDRIVRYLTSGQGGLISYQQYNGRYASWKPVGNGVFIVEIMEKQE